MGKNSDFYKSKEDNFFDKYEELTEILPAYTYDYIKNVRNFRAPSTLVAYCFDLVTFFEWIVYSNPLYSGLTIREVPLSALERLTAQDIDEYRDYLRNKNGHSNATNSIERKITPVRGLFDYMVRYKIIKANPVSGTGMRIREDKSDIERLTRAQVKELKETVARVNGPTERSKKYCEHTAERDSAIVNLFLSTGIRVSELQGLDIDDVDYREKRITVVRKGGKSSHIYLTDEMLTILFEYINGERETVIKGCDKNERALFLSLHHNRMNIKSIENVVKKYTQKVTGKASACHNLRRTYGTELYSATGDIRLVADVLGHSSVNTTAKHYAAVDEANRERAAGIDLYEK